MSREGDSIAAPSVGGDHEDEGLAPPTGDVHKDAAFLNSGSRVGSGIFPIKTATRDKVPFEIPGEDADLELPGHAARRQGLLAASKCSSAKLRRSQKSPVSVTSDQVLITQPVADDDDDDDSDIFRTRQSDVGSDSTGEDDSEYGSEANSFIMAPAEVDIEDADGFDTDVEFDEKEFLDGEDKGFDPTGVKDYIRECNKLGVIPVSFFQRHIHDREFVMKNHGLGPLGAKAISKPLEANTVIEKLNLEGNSIEGDGVVFICQALKENLYITELLLSHNNLRSFGCHVICTTLIENKTITALDLSGNKLKDCDGEHIHNLLINNMTIKKLNLDHNEFEIEGPRWLRDALTQNENLKMLSLSWNNVRLKGAEYIGEMVQENYGLKYLNLQMNGLADVGAKALGHALLHNQCLVDLNITDNRVTKEGALFIARGLVGNDELATLRIGFNPLGLDGALALLMGLDKNECPGMNLLDMTNVIVPDEFVTLQEKVESEGKRFKVIHGGVLYMSKKVRAAAMDPEEAFARDPMTKLKNYAAKAKIRLIDLFKRFDFDNSWTITRDELVKGVQMTGIDLTEEDIDSLIGNLDIDGDGEIDYRELVLGDKEHRKQKQILQRRNDTKPEEDLLKEAEDDVTNRIVL